MLFGLLELLFVKISGLNVASFFLISYESLFLRTSLILFCTYSYASELNVKLGPLYIDSSTGYHKSGNSYLNINLD